MADFRNQLKDFIINNNLIGLTAGVSIGLVTKDAISSLVGDVIIPLIVIILSRFKIPSLIKILPINSGLSLINFIKNLVSWFFIVLFTYLFIQFAFIKLLGLEDKKK